MNQLNEFNINKESFDIKPEIIVSKIINEHSKEIYTEKNMLNPYDYDLHCFDKKKNFLGYIEVEVSNHKRLSGANWQHSFLARKVLKYDKDKGYVDWELRDNADKTIYIKFNKYFGLVDCICCSIESITYFDSDLEYKTGDERKDLVFRTHQDNPRVAKGIKKCIEYIERFFEV